ncbi:MAG: glycoside hydrolase family 5 protein [Defluviitaleaceae bacterium]|nr:glycoside hydrolase family 5 protein [Defluviitaleaceae bacterium]
MKKFSAVILLAAIFAFSGCACDEDYATPPDAFESQGTQDTSGDAGTAETSETPAETSSDASSETRDVGDPGLTPVSPSLPARASSRERSPMSDISSADFVAAMGPGWNLGNQFDAQQYQGLGFSWLGDGTYAGTSVAQLETAWVGGTASVVTQEFIQTVSDAGFEAIRIPVTWNKVAPGPDYIIRDDWMERVYEVVGWAYDAGMHIVLNTHHENSFNTHETIHAIGLTDAEVEHSIHILSTWWTQIAGQFEPFGERLMFAGLNEPRTPRFEWTGGSPEARANLNRLNQAFVDAVRATGGNNESRFLLVPTHAASATLYAFEGFEIPTDSADDRIIMAIHTYSPFQWAHDGEGTYGGAHEIRPSIERVAEQAEILGVSVMLTEWGSINNGEEGNLAQREQHAYDYASIAREFGMAAFWWDNGSANPGTHGFGLFNRATREITHPGIIDAIVRAYE